MHKMAHLRDILSNEKNILIATAHPDDSAIMLGGFIQSAVKILGSHHVFVVVATNGETGENYLPPGNENFVKEGRRQEEEQAALKFLKVQKQNIFFAQLPDGEVEKVANLRLLSAEIAAICQKHNISTIATLGPQNDGHPDHIATHKAAIQASRQLGNVKALALNGTHTGKYVLELTQAVATHKLAAASQHASQYNTPGWFAKKGTAYVMGPKFGQASSFYPPLAKAETFDYA